MHVAYPCAATVFSDTPPSAQSQVLSRSVPPPAYAAHAAAVPRHPGHFRPVPARAHHLQRRSVLTARLTACTYLGTIPNTTCVRRGHSPPSALRPLHPTTAPILSVVPPPDTRAYGMQHEDNGSTRPARAHGDDSYAVRRNLDPAVLPPAARLLFGNADPPQARAGERGEGLLTAGLLEKC
ncbi:hypothetical protein B0H14DRAFT_201545 [Mycena olivaceomarginata]|nr:hypothetical protein B0H14DRAFT_201545 [Mycena olivaceomarginata]